MKRSKLREIRGSTANAVEVEAVNLKYVDDRLHLREKAAIQLVFFVNVYSRDLIVLDIAEAESLQRQLGKAIRAARAVKEE
jgi:hypothetical protein